jgi:glycosyltransferase involved in cell wall biosynthesis
MAGDPEGWCVRELRSRAAAASESTAAAREDITIVIPVYQGAAYLPAAIASALHSPVRRILVADDGSDAETLRVAEELAAAHPHRVRVLASPTNRGTAVNLNEAVGHVETPFFAKLDGDDVLLPGYLETVFPVIASRPRLAVLAGHELRIRADEAVVFRPELLPPPRDLALVRIMADAEAFRFIINWSPNPTSSGAIYRSDAFREVGGFNRGMDWGEDWEIWLQFARQWEVGYVDAPSALYRIHQQSTTATATRQHRLCYGYDAVLRGAAEVCRYPDVFPLIRRRMLGVTKLYMAAAARQVWSSRRGSLDCCLKALGAFSIAVGKLPAPSLPKDAARRKRRPVERLATLNERSGAQGSTCAVGASGQRDVSPVDSNACSSQETS